MSKSIKILWRSFFIGVGFVILLILLASWGVFGKMPSIDELQNPTASLASEVYAEDGTTMGKYYLQDRVNVEFKDISKHVINALVATEDERFYDHNGIDPRSLARAFFSFGGQGGASTLTMQTAKNLFTENWSTSNFLMRSLQKIKECIIAVKLERNFTKDEIITLYLNTVAFGDNVYGIKNASKTFFKKDPDRLNVDEAAVLVGMLKAATLYNPRRNPYNALKRRNTVINQMVRNNYLSEGEAAVIKTKPIVLNYQKMDENNGLAPYLRMVMGEEMKRWCKSHNKPNGDAYDLYRDGLKIYTTINPRMQIYAEEAVGKQMSAMQKELNYQSNIKTGSVWKNYESVLQAAMKNSDRWRNMKKEGVDEDDIKKSFYQKTPMKVFAWNNNRGKDTVMTPYDSIRYHRQMLQAGFMAMDPQNGEIKAWVGGIDFKTYKYDHVNVGTRRQVGSTIKPLLYSMAIEDGGFTPSTPVEDVQQSFGQYGTVPATGATCTGRTMSMAEALAWSRNCATAYIMKQVGGAGADGAKRFIEFLRNCSVQSQDLQPYPSIAIGSGEISLYEMMQAYSMFPGRGFNVKPFFITRIEDRNGNVLQTNMPQRKEVISENTAYSVISMMQGVVQHGTGRRMWSYGVSGDIAGKTGTTNDNSDAWFMGYTPQLLAGVWTGCDDRFIRLNSKAGEGASMALPVWAYFYQKCLADPNLNIDKNAHFIKPESMNNEVIYDWNSSTTLDLGAQGENMGNGTAENYSDVPPEGKPEDIGAESDTLLNKPNRRDNNVSPSGNGTRPINQPIRKRDNNRDSTLPGQKPKATMPKKEEVKPPPFK
ncbi:MAG: penicillin-binding protein [Chitinophagaceae bacterium]|nr:penicillin-binding protein [Chitinophagaceae bacterium]